MSLCGLFRSLGNESGYGRTHDKMAAFIRANEKDRVLMYEPATYGPRDKGSSSSYFGGGSTDFTGKKTVVSTDILCPMYPKVIVC